MGQPDERAKGQGLPSSLTAAVLAAVIERHSYGYEIHTRVNRRIGADWPLRRVYDVLKRLDREGLVWSEVVLTDAKRRWRRIYRATDLGEETRTAWTYERHALPEGRADIRAWLVFSSPEEAPQLLVALDEYEKDCIELGEGNTEVAVPRASWTSRMLSLSREGFREQLRSEIGWINRVRREIEEYLAESR